MPVPVSLKEEIKNQIEKTKQRAIEISDYIFNNPETGGKEFAALALLTEELKSNGFKVTTGQGGLQTAFSAVYDFHIEGPEVAFIAEYDALPAIGHACHHHIIASSAVNSAIALSRIKKGLKGKISVVGTPAEEIMDAKTLLYKKGVFKGVDAAIMLHGGSKNITNLIVLAIEGLDFHFKGRAAHAAAAPHEGVNALDAVILFFNAVNALRQQLPDGTRIHGIITKGGDAVNIIPENAAASFYIRSKSRAYLDELVIKVRNCAKGAAIQTGTKLKISRFEASGKNLLINHNLCTEFEKNLENLGASMDREPFIFGSSDIGNLSNLMPVLHPVVQTAPAGTVLHTEKSRDCGKSQIAYNGMILGMKACALTAARILLDRDFFEKIKKEFEESDKISI